MKRRNIAGEHDEYKKQLNIYYWKCFASEFSKICVFFLIFMCLNLIPEYIIALFTLMVLRSNGGGLHFKHFISCLVVSFIFLYSSILLAKYIIPPKSILYTSILLCLPLGYALVPITSSNRPPATSEQIGKSKRNTAISILFLFILICLCSNMHHIYICYWTIILHILQLIIAHIKEVKKNV